jgi:cytochrome oxidase assembly protein ShyY1
VERMTPVSLSGQFCPDSSRHLYNVRVTSGVRVADDL